MYNKQKYFVTLLLAAIIAASGCTTTPLSSERKVVPETNDAVIPAPKDRDWWLPRHDSVKQRLADGGADLLMIGDSITHRWEDNGKVVWEQHYAPRNAVNMGFSGDRTQNVLWRLDNGELDGVDPKLIVIMIGTNNSNGDDHSAAEIADGIIAVCNRVRVKLPQSRILLLAIFPRGNAVQRASSEAFAKPNDQWRKNDEASRLAATIADDEKIFFLDIGAAFLAPGGELSRDMMPDFLHLSEEGYKAWALAMEPTIARLMDEEQ